MYNFLNLMRTRRLLRASCHQSSFSFSLSRARARSLEVYYRYVRKKFFKFSFVRVDLSDRSRLLRECIVSSASSLCVHNRLFLF